MGNHRPKKKKKAGAKHKAPVIFGIDTGTDMGTLFTQPKKWFKDADGHYVKELVKPAPPYSPYYDKPMVHFCDNPKCPYHVLVRTKGKTSWTTMQNLMPHVIEVVQHSDGSEPGDFYTLTNEAHLEGHINLQVQDGSGGWKHPTTYRIKHSAKSVGVSRLFTTASGAELKITGRFCEVCAGALDAFMSEAKKKTGIPNMSEFLKSHSITGT